MWRIRTDVVGNGACLYSLPNSYNQANISKLIYSLREHKLSLESFQKLGVENLGLSESQCLVLYTIFRRLIRPFEKYFDDSNNQSQIAMFGIFLITQFLNQYANSSVTKLRSKASEVFPEKQPSSTTTSASTTAVAAAAAAPTPSPRHRPAFFHGLPKRSASERGFSVESVNAAIAPMAAPPKKQTESQTPPPTNKKRSLPVASKDEVIMVKNRNSLGNRRMTVPAISSIEKPEENMSAKNAKWKKIPSTTHQYFEDFQAMFLLEYLSPIIRICSVAAGTQNPSTMHKLLAEEIEPMRYFLYYADENSVNEETLGAPLAETLECFLKHTNVYFFDVISAISVILRGLLDEESILSESRIVHYNSVNRKTLKFDDSLTPQQSITITNSFRSYLYYPCALSHCTISCLSNCTVFIGAASGIVNLQSCSTVILIASCHSVIINNCKDCVLHIGTNTQPILIGDNNNIQLSPLNTYYPNHGLHLEIARIDTKINLWNEPVNGSLQLLRIPSQYASLLSPTYFHKFVVPNILEGDSKEILFPLPKEYEDVLVKSEQQYQEARQSVLSIADLEHSKIVQNVLWNNFKGWLAASGNLRQIEDLMKYDSDEVVNL
eukprot:c20539_g1_i1.p1 GENE.c20539_g1_i1~~c20539_g1_i1.p1  ORF type:complete len:607 (-),score=218.82 c20539_g1_i1:117-1937(-)